MKHVFYLALLSIMMTSCVSILSQPYTTVTVNTTKPGKIVYKNDTLNAGKNRVTLDVRRKKEPVTITAITDSLTKTIDVKSRISRLYWLNIAYGGGIGLLIDRDHPNRYAYPRNVFINSADTISRYFKYPQGDINKGEIHLHVSLPHINSFRLVPNNETPKINTGYWGYNLGLDYYHSNNQFIHLSASGVADIFMPFPAAVTFGEGERELMYSTYISLSNNHRINRFKVGYGLSYAKNNWRFIFDNTSNTLFPIWERVEKSHYSFGLVFPMYYQFGEYFHVGVIYRPTFYRPRLVDKFKYEHLISFDFAWKIRLKRGRN